MTPSTEDTERLLAETGWLRDLARCLVAGRDLADDVAQETLLRAWQRPPGSVHNLRGWLAAVAHSVALRFARTEQRQRRRLQSLPPRDPEVSAGEVCERTQRQRDVMDAALRLAEPYRSPVLLRYQGGLGYAAIAQRLAVPIETVRTRIKRGLAQLRGELDARHGGTPAWALPVLGIGWQGGAVAASAGGVLVMATLGKVACVLAVATAVWVAMPSDDAAPLVRDEVRGKDETAAAAASGDLSRALAAAAAQPEQRTAADLPEPASVPSRSQDVPAPDTWELAGRVVDAQTAQPIAGAFVSFGRMPVEFRGSQAEHGRSPLVFRDFGNDAVDPPAEGPLPRETTDVDGCFRLTGVVRSEPDELVVEAADHAPNRSQLGPWFELAACRDPPAHAIDLGDVPLQRGACISGRVVAADGVSPVPDARISLARSIESLLSYEVLGEAGPDGHFAFPHRFAAGSTTTSIVAKSRLGTGWTLLGPTGPGEDLVIVLRPCASLQCTVVDDLGRPIESAGVNVQATFAPFMERIRIVASGAFGPKLSNFARTDPRGLAVLDAITLGDAVGPSGERTLRVTAAGHRCEERTIVLRPGDNEVRVVLARGSSTTVRGTVVSGIDGQPVPGAGVAAGPPRPCTTDAAGAFEIRDVDLSDRVLFVAVDARGFVPAFVTVPAAGRTGDVEVRIVLQPGAPVRGVVRDQHGAPVAGARIEHRTEDRLLAYSDAEGRFELRAAPLGSVPLRLVPPFADLVFDGPLEFEVAVADRETVALTLRRRR